MESAPNTPERKQLKQPRRIDQHDVQWAKNDLPYWHQKTEDHPEPSWERMQSTLEDFNLPVAQVLQEALDKAANDEEKARIADTVWIVYWAAVRAHDPNNKLEYPYNDKDKIDPYDSVITAEQLKV